MGARARKTRGNHSLAAPATASSAAAAFTPDALSVAARHLEVGGEWVASFAVVGFPREVHPGWLSPLLTYPGRLDVSVHIEPIEIGVSRRRELLERWFLPLRRDVCSVVATPSCPVACGHGRGRRVRREAAG